MKVNLTWYEAEMAAKVGMARAFSSMSAGHNAFKHGLVIATSYSTPR